MTAAATILERRLEALAATGVSPLVAQGTTDAGHALRTILGEADSVVMPRELALTGADGKSGLILEVANRRILSARPASGGAAPVVIAAESAETLRAMLLDLVEATPAIRIRHTPLRRALDPAEPGLTVRGLAEAWDIDFAPPRSEEDGDILDGFLAAAADALPACLMVSGEICESFGDEDLVEALVPLSESGLVLALRDGRDGEPWRFVAVGPFIEDAPHRAIGAIGETLFLMAIAPGRLEDVAGHWRRALS